MYVSCALHARNDFMFMLSPYLCSLVTFLHHMLSVRAYRHYRFMVSFWAYTVMLYTCHLCVLPVLVTSHCYVMC